MKTESPILSASIGENGGFVLVTDESGYKTAVAVYNNNGAQVFKWYSAEYYILAAALSPDGNYLAVLGFQQAGVELKSELLFWRIGKEEAEARFELGSSLGYDVEFMNSSTAAVMTDHGAYLVTRKGVLLGQLELSPGDLIGYIFSDRGITRTAAAALYEWDTFRRTPLYFLRNPAYFRRWLDAWRTHYGRAACL